MKEKWKDPEYREMMKKARQKKKTEFIVKHKDDE